MNLQYPYLRKHFARRRVPAECVQRTQGLMVPKGNLLGIREFADIAGKRYVNRQKGSGTRILCDHLARQNKVDPECLGL